MSRCPRCGGQDGAHYVACTLQNAIQRWLGPDYPLFPPDTASAAEALQITALTSQVGVMKADLEETVQAVLLAMRQNEEMRRDLDAAIDAITKPQPPPQDDTDLTADDIGEMLDRGEPVEVNAQPNGRPKGQPPDVMARAREVARNQADAQRERAEPIIRRVLELTTDHDKDGWIPGPELYEAVKAADPTVTPRVFGMVMTRIGHGKKQMKVPDGSMPVHYRGYRWKEVTPRKEPSLSEQMEQRRAAEEAAKAEMPPQPEPKERYRYDGPRPGKEIPPEYKELLEPLWEEPGWSYAPRNENGGGKPRVRNPEGTQYVLSNTPSDVRGIRNVRAALRRLGAKI